MSDTTAVIIVCGVIKSADKSFSWGYNIGFKPIKVNLQSPLINPCGCSDKKFRAYNGKFYWTTYSCMYFDIY